MKRVYLLLGAAILSITAMAATPEITSVFAQQRYPWNGKVDITYTVSGDVSKYCYENGLLSPMIKVSAKDGESNVTYNATKLSGDNAVTEGEHRIVWDLDAEGLGIRSSNVVFNVTCEATEALYCVIDLSGGKDATSYPVTYLAKEPVGGFTSDTYRGKKLALRRINAGSFIMGSDQADNSHRVTLTKPFYMGVFEVTDLQWLSVSSYSGYSSRKPHMTTYNAIRGADSGSLWPSSSAVDSTSFLGLLQSRTNLKFDLPTEAQWEYACRAGTKTTFSCGRDLTSEYGWTWDTGGRDLNEVGLLKPNPWGLYDMHGNIGEWCLDWYGELQYGIDPKGSTDGKIRIARGGTYYSDNEEATSSYRYGSAPNSHNNNDGYYLGFRLSMQIEGGTIPSCSSESVRINQMSGSRNAANSETIQYSAFWESDIARATAEIVVDGETVNSSNGSGAFTWMPTRNGTYTLEHVVKVDGEQVGGTLTATFVVEGLNPENPVITPGSGTVFTDSLTVMMSCPSDGAVIRYTLDGSEPTVTSDVYQRKFRIFGKTTIKARAFYENGEGSDTVSAEYALGQCPDPMINSTGGVTFLHKGNAVAIDWSCEDGLLRYTLDGSEPTMESPVYNEPFTIDETTTVRAKAFGMTYFDSATVTQTFTRAWEQVSTPVISAVESFSGSKTMVSLSCATEGAMIRYTLDGSEPDSHSRRYSGPFEIRESAVIKAFAALSDYSHSEVATKTISKEWCIGDSVGLPDHTFTTATSTGWVDDDGVAMKSGKITHQQTSVLSSTFVGKGRISFEVMTSCEEDDPAYIEYDRFEIWIDDVPKMKQDGVHDWAEFTFDLAEGTHVVEWKYVKDEMDGTPYPGEDCVRVRNIVWMPEKTQLSGEKVPLAWLREKYPSLGAYYFDYEEKAESDAANGMKVWECYVAGLEPTIATDQVKANITLTNNVPYITWSPDLNTNGEVRVYKVWGKSRLDDEDEVWMYPTNGTHRFFKVSVGMP